MFWNITDDFTSTSTSAASVAVTSPENYQKCEELAQETCYNRPQVGPKTEEVTYTCHMALLALFYSQFCFNSLESSSFSLSSKARVTSEVFVRRWQYGCRQPGCPAPPRPSPCPPWPARKWRRRGESWPHQPSFLHLPANCLPAQVCQPSVPAARGRAGWAVHSGSRAKHMSTGRLAVNTG